MKSDMQTARQTDRHGKHGDKEGVTNRVNVQNSDRKKSCQRDSGEEKEEG